MTKIYYSHTHTHKEEEEEGGGGGARRNFFTSHRRKKIAKPCFQRSDRRDIAGFFLRFSPPLETLLAFLSGFLPSATLIKD